VNRLAASTIALAAILSVSCSGTSPSATPSGSSVNVVTSTTVFADLVRNVGGNHVTVRSLVPNGGEVHTFDPRPSDAAVVSDSELLVYNGLGLDDWLVPFAQQVGMRPNAQLLALAPNQPEVSYIDDNPHLWMDPAYARLYVDEIRLKLIELDPAGQPDYDANAARYDHELSELDDWARGQIATLPAGSRRLVSFHDAFPYFAAAYDLEVVGVVVAAPGQDPSPAQVAALIEAIRASGVRAILAESQFNPAMAQTIADETGATVVSDLYTDSLGDPPVDTYAGALRWDVERIVAALQ
jgi:zinc/manganese transport system substrate-binding protein/manganese/iron transport system substrate-binding protein